ncbi:outer membrane protein assembly factor BamB family protein [Lignipirellula cremea]|uniref:Outer membrane biogenesis protein BamB n=1 Tax=Lignipirellula cremea TaxID=2528010 RepID=A0A518E057_9BACT|nr:PQQ-binding-like beta-propeller repeat protein [Lignipirellula cremea]QDU97472.1 outer membrane biogenesis protein BamB [Lignipirellula cremea]
MSVSRVFFLSLLCLPLPALAQEWPQFRGPGGQGLSQVQAAPLTWSEDSANIAWKVPIAGLGWSSPVVADGRIWLTTASEDGASLRLISLDLETGRELQNVEVLHLETVGRIHNKNSHASPTPVLEDDRVYVHFGNYGTACLTTAGEPVWRTKIDYPHVHGPGGSPVVYQDVLIIICDGSSEPFVTGLDKRTGEELWRTARPENDGKKFAFSTPLLIEVDGVPQAVCPGAGGVSSYNPLTGEELWRVDYPGGYSVTPRPAYGSGLVFVSSGFNRPVLYAIRPTGRGNVSETHVAWTTDRGAPHSPSPLVVDDALYLVSDRGVAVCLDAKTGEQVWQERVGGNYSASPLLAAGRIYALSEEGVTTVFAAGKEYKELAVNTLPGRTLATPAPIEGALLLRTDTHLYRINQ